MGIGIDDVKALFDDGEDLFSGTSGSQEDLAGKFGVSKPSVPTKSPVFSYPSVKQGMACQEVIQRYNLAVLKLRASHMTAEEKAQRIADVLYPILSSYMELADLLNIDLSVGGAGSTPSGATDKFPACLTKWAESLAAIEAAQNAASSAASGALDDIKNSAAAQALDGMLGDLSSFMDDMLGDAGDFGDDIKELTNGISDMIGNIHDNLIFPIVQALEEFILSSEYASDIADLLEMRKCIEQNCQAGLGSLIDLDNIIYIGAESVNGYIVPIEPGSGSVLLSKLYNQDKEGTGLNKPHNKDALKKVERRYKDWKREKQKAQDAVKKNAENSLGGIEIPMDSLPGLGADAGDALDIGSYSF